MITNQDYLNRLRAVECSNSTYLNANLVFDRAMGSTIYDVEGNKYLDLCAGFGVMILGHSSDTLKQALHQHLNHDLPPIIHGQGDVFPSRSKVEFLEALKSFLPPHLSKAACALSGGQAVEIALKSAFLATGASGVIAFDGGYHGLDLGILPLTSSQKFRQPFASWIDCQKLRRLPYGCSKETLSLAIKELSGAGIKTAAVIVEPIQGRGGIVGPNLEWLTMVRELTEEQGILLIFDEVFTGVGRSGRFSFAEAIPCDLLCLGKALGGGFPLSVCIGSERAMQGWPVNSGEAIHTGTFFGHPFSCDLATRVLATIKADNLILRSKMLGDRFKATLKSLLAGSPAVDEIRGEGLMIGIKFKQEQAGTALMDKLLKERIITLPSGTKGEVLSLTPALTIAEKDLLTAANKIANVIFSWGKPLF